jgi:phenylacetaldehyde dehydrogenase
VLWRVAELIDEHADELAQLETLDNGKPVTYSRGLDVPATADIFRYMAGWATKVEGATIPISVEYMPGAEFHAYTEREPVGVCGQIIPWNFPLVMAGWKLAPALAVGCTVVLKPAEETPLTALRLGELLLEAGVPEGVVNIVPGFGETAGAALAAHPGVDKVAFTGSTEVGRLIVHAAARNMKKVSLELGGKSPNVIFADADLSQAIPGAAAAIFMNTGQVCGAGSRLYVERRAFDDVIGAISQAAKGLRVGPGAQPDTEIGPLVSETQERRVTGYLQSARADGAEIVTGGGKLGERGYFVEPTVIVGAKPDAAVVQEEIFGPVVVAQPFDEPDEIPPVANSTIYGLAAGVWTRDISLAHRTARQLRAGTVWVNCYHVYDSALPFGGYKQSGWGREMGREVLDLYTQTKAICVQL